MQVVQSQPGRFCRPNVSRDHWADIVEGGGVVMLLSVHDRHGSLEMSTPIQTTNPPTQRPIILNTTLHKSHSFLLARIGLRK